ncbi:MAG: hypothetical protein Tsb002_15660 [Wenzhouxiangellaceae bacterium]
MLTNGYDYVFSLSRDEVNTILNDNLKDKEIQLEYQTTDADSGTQVVLHFQLSPWKIVAGGGGKLVNFSLPVKQGYMSLEGGALPSNSYDLTGIALVIQVELGWLGAGDELQTEGSGDVDRLIFDPRSNVKNPGYVSPVAILDADGQLDTIGKGVLNAVLVNALVANKDKLQYILANVNPEPANTSSWLKPYKWQYFNVDSKAGPSALAFLCQLSDKPFPAQATFDADNLSAADNSLVLISQPVFFDHVVLPAVRSAFPGGAFTASVGVGEQVTITNQGEFDLGRVTAYQFSLHTSDSGNGLRIAASGGGSLKFFFGLGSLPHAHYHWSVTAVNPLQYSNGKISFVKDAKPAITHDHNMHWYDWALIAAVGITSTSGLVSAIVDGINDWYDNSEAMGLNNINNAIQASAIDSVVNLTDLIDWNKPGESFQPTTAGLQTSLFVRGNLSSH